MSMLALTTMQGSEVSSASTKNSDGCNVNGMKPNFSSSSPKTSLPRHGEVQSKETIQDNVDPGRGSSPIKDEKSCEVECASEEATMTHKLDPCPSSTFEGSPTISNKSSHMSRRLTVWGRTPVSKTFHLTLPLIFPLPFPVNVLHSISSTFVIFLKCAS